MAFSLKGDSPSREDGMLADGSMVTGVGVWWLAHTLADQEAELGTFESQQLSFLLHVTPTPSLMGQPMFR